jgi:predicted XRE-type DNA-binding protein
MNTKHKAEPKVMRGSVNIFKDLGYADADERFAKMELAYKINALIEQAGRNQTQAAKILGVDRARVSNLSRGRLTEFSLDTLFGFLIKLGQDIEVSIRPKRRKQASFHVVVA